MFALHEDAEIPAEHVRDAQHGARQEDFRRRLLDDGMVLADFCTPGELESKINTALSDLAVRSAAPPQRALRARGRRPRVDGVSAPVS